MERKRYDNDDEGDENEDTNSKERRQRMDDGNVIKGLMATAIRKYNGEIKGEDDLKGIKQSLGKKDDG